MTISIISAYFSSTPAIRRDIVLRRFPPKASWVFCTVIAAIFRINVGLDQHRRTFGAPEIMYPVQADGPNVARITPEALPDFLEYGLHFTALCYFIITVRGTREQNRSGGVRRKGRVWWWAVIFGCGAPRKIGPVQRTASADQLCLFCRASIRIGRDK